MLKKYETDVFSKEGLIMNILDLEFIKGFIRMCSDGLLKDGMNVMEETLLIV